MDIKKEPEDSYFEIEIPPLSTSVNEDNVNKSYGHIVDCSVDSCTKIKDGNTLDRIKIKSEAEIKVEIIPESNHYDEMLYDNQLDIKKNEYFKLGEHSNENNVIDDFNTQNTKIKEEIVPFIYNNNSSSEIKIESNSVADVKKGFPQFYNGENLSCVFDLHKIVRIKLYRIDFFGRNFVCPVCFLIFRSLKLLTDHKLKLNHQFVSLIDKKEDLVLPDENLFACDLCPFKCKARNSLKRHKFTHSNLKPFKCDVCNSDFRQACHLKSHKLTHSNVYPYKCEICGVGFKNPSNLKRHKMSHGNERAHKCLTCTAAFIQLDHLKVHSMIHNNEAPFPCHLCTMRFRRTINLRRHMKVHAKKANKNKIAEDEKDTTVKMGETNR